MCVSTIPAPSTMLALLIAWYGTPGTGLELTASLASATNKSSDPGRDFLGASFSTPIKERDQVL